MSEYRRGDEIAGRFLIEERIGSGGMGAVYRALQTSLDREVALKVLHAQNAFTARDRRRFAREARAIARLNHPHIASVFDFGADEESSSSLWLAMELVVGTTMIALRQEPLDLVRLLALTDQTLSALAAAHAREIVHRDLKPSNVLIARVDDGREVIKLVDFGLAATRDGELTLDRAPLGPDDVSEVSEARASKKRTILGTPRYMAPEIFRRAPLDPKVDLYALGVMLFEIISGLPPYQGAEPRETMRAHLRDPIPRLHARDEQSIPPEFERFIYALLAKDPSERPESAAVARQTIASILGEFSFAPWAALGPRNDASTFGLAAPPSSESDAGIARGGQTIAPRLLGGGASGIGRARAALAPPLVGRAPERRELQQHLRAAVRLGRGALILIDGEEGVGKTRLVEWIGVRVRESGVMQLGAGSCADSPGIAGGLRAALAQLIGADHDARAAGRALERWGFAPKEIDLALRIVNAAPQRAELSGAEFADQERAFALLERLVRAAAAERPLLLVIEDLHEAGEFSIGFLEHLAVGLHLAPAPLVVVATLRSERIAISPRLRDALERLGRFGSSDITRISLSRLSAIETAKLVGKLAPISDALASAIAERCAGNPLHALQTLRFLQESSRLQFASGRWELAEGAELDQIVPDEVAEMMQRRADLIISASARPETTRAIMGRAAILGHRFEYALLRVALSVEPGAPWLGSLDGVLEELVRGGVLVEVGSSGADVLAFDHQMMRDALLATLERDRSMRALHAHAAEAKIRFWGARVDARALEIARHFQQARRPRGVYEYTLRAARSALSACDLRGAMGLFRRAEQIASSISGGSGGLDEISAALSGEEVGLEVAHLERRLGEYESAREAYRTLLGSIEPAITLWARWGIGDLALRQGEHDEAQSWFETARRESVRVAQLRPHEPAPLSDLVDAYCLCGIGQIAQHRGDLGAAQRALSEALLRAGALSEPLLETEIERALSSIAWRQGDEERADEHARRAALIAERHGDAEERALEALFRARSALARGRPSEAGEFAARALLEAESLGKRHTVAHALMIQAELAWGRGEVKPSARIYRKALRFYEMFRDRRGLTRCRARLAAVAAAVGRPADAARLVRDALEGFRAMGDRCGEAKCWILIGELERDAHDPAKAARTFSEGARLWREAGDLRGALVAHALRAHALYRAGDRQSASTLLEETHEYFASYYVYDTALLAALDDLVIETKSELPRVSRTLAAAAERVRAGLGRSIAAGASQEHLPMGASERVGTAR